MRQSKIARTLRPPSLVGPSLSTDCEHINYCERVRSGQMSSLTVGEESSYASFQVYSCQMCTFALDETLTEMTMNNLSKIIIILFISQVVRKNVV